MNPLLQCKPTILPLFIAGVLACFGLLPKALAVVPPPDGGYPGFTTAEGTKALQNLTAGAGNTGLGWFSLFSATTASFNTGVGAGTLVLDTADNNTAVGTLALFLNTTGSKNTAVGSRALLNNMEGVENTAVGFQALSSNLASGFHCAFGVNALLNTTTDSFANNAFGVDALDANTTGSRNIAVGDDALGNNVIGSDNTALGDSAGFDITGDNNICIGSGVGGIAGEFDTIRIGDNLAPVAGTDSKVFFGGIALKNVGANFAPVLINLVSGQLGTIPSSARFKKDIESMGKSSEVIFSLRPVTFHYKGDETNIPQFGLIAEEVAKVNPGLILLDKEGNPQSVRYEQINAMLLNEFLKEHKKVEEQQSKIDNQQATITQLKKDFGATIAQLTARLDEQAAQIQKVSVQLEASKPAPQVVAENQ
jgi:Chaperone of endosialidase